MSKVLAVQGNHVFKNDDGVWCEAGREDLHQVSYHVGYGDSEKKRQEQLEVLSGQLKESALDVQLLLEKLEGIMETMY